MKIILKHGEYHIKIWDCDGTAYSDKVNSEQEVRDFFASEKFLSKYADENKGEYGWGVYFLTKEGYCYADGAEFGAPYKE